MKNKIEIKKLSLNKETVTILNPKQLKAIVGGVLEQTPTIITTLRTGGSQGTGQ
jgi:hypothetical protein